MRDIEEALLQAVLNEAVENIAPLILAGARRSVSLVIISY